MQDRTQLLRQNAQLAWVSELAKPAYGIQQLFLAHPTVECKLSSAGQPVQIIRSWRYNLPPPAVTMYQADFCTRVGPEGPATTLTCSNMQFLECCIQCTNGSDDPGQLACVLLE